MVQVAMQADVASEELKQIVLFRISDWLCTRRLCTAVAT